MRGARTRRTCLLLALPTAVLVALGLLFLVKGVPRLAANEHRWAMEEMRRVARDLKARRAAPDFVWEYGRGVVDGAPDWARAAFPAAMTWKDWGSKGKKKRAEMWGWRDAGRRRVVWVRDGRTVYGRTADIREVDYAFLFWLFGLLGLASLVATTAFTLHRLVAYARSRDDFLAATAHDLTTPLAALRYTIGVDDGEAQTLVVRMLRMVDNIRDFMRLGGRRSFAREAFDLRRALDAAYAPFAADFRELFGGADAAVEEVGGPHRVMADEQATVQILWNLLGNELKYAASHGPVTIRLSSDGATGRVEVADAGPGMTRRQMRRVFDRYYRARTALQSGKGGFGIGLCVAREFARDMGGDLAVRPNRPAGCVFTLTLPVPPEGHRAATQGA